MRRRSLAPAAAVVALVGGAGCDWILGIEPVPVPDASADATTDGGDASPLEASAPDGWCATGAPKNAYFCDDFDSDAGATGKWDSHSGLVQLMDASADAGSLPYALLISPDNGPAFVEKSVSFNGSTASVQFVARDNAQCGAARFAVITIQGQSQIKPLYVTANNPSLGFLFTDLTNTVLFQSDAGCDGWHAFTVYIAPNQVTAQFDTASAVLLDAGPDAMTGVILDIGAGGNNPGPETAGVDNVAVSP